MPQYLAPGVYVEEVPSAHQADRGRRHQHRGVHRRGGRQRHHAPAARPDGIQGRRQPRLSPMTSTRSPTAGCRSSSPAGRSSRTPSATSRPATRPWPTPSTASSTTAAPAAGSPASPRAPTPAPPTASSIDALDASSRSTRSPSSPPRARPTPRPDARSSTTARTPQDRFAILDGRQTDRRSTTAAIQGDGPATATTRALYFPWIQVFDPATNDDDLRPAERPRRRHLRPGRRRARRAQGAGQRGRARRARPASTLISKARAGRAQPGGHQRASATSTATSASGARARWAATRTPSGKYINVRRLFLFLRESIDEGTQWVVFEPNDTGLWAKITRNVTAFLTNVWRAGALFGTTPAGGLLRQVRRGDQPAGGPRPRPGGDRDRRGGRQAGRVRHLPHQPVGRARQ